MIASSHESLLFLEEFERALREKILFLQHPHDLLLHATQYVIENPGKRIRPLLVFYTATALGADLKDILMPAMAIELIHTYSLIHDDLPCMDDDDMRRGKPTLHRMYNEGQAVLVGDLLLTYSFELLASSDLTPQKRLSLISILAQRSGGSGMILGQSMDLAMKGKTLSWNDLQELHLRKTGDLISAACEMGAIIADTSLEVQATMRQIGQYSGLAFQLVDDLLDKEHLSSQTLSSHALLDQALDLCQSLGLQDSCLTQFLPKLISRAF